jgi:hypothetical protein
MAEILNFSMSSDDQSVNGFSECAEKNIQFDSGLIRKVQTEKEALKKAQEIALKIMKDKMINTKSNKINYSTNNINRLYKKGESNIFLRPLYSMNQNQFPKNNNINSFVSPCKNQINNVPLSQPKQIQVMQNNLNPTKEDEKCNNLFDNKIYISQVIPISKSIINQHGANGVGINYSNLYASFGTNFNNNINNINETPLTEEEKKINYLLKEIYSFGEETKKIIENQKENDPKKFISIEDAIKYGTNRVDSNGFKNELFVLGVLAQVLTSHGCSVVIEKKEPKTEIEKKELHKTIQYLVNGMFNFITYTFHFNFKEKMYNYLMSKLNNISVFNQNLKLKLKEIFNLKENDILMTEGKFHTSNSYSVTAILKKSKYNNYPKEQIINNLMQFEEFRDIKCIEKSILLRGCRLNPYMIDSRGNNRNGGWGFNELRGGKQYYPPEGWVGYGIRVVDVYDSGNNAWIGYSNSGGEWSVAYQGIGLSNSSNIYFSNMVGIKHSFTNSEDIFHKGKKVGEGIYVTPKPKVMEKYCNEYLCCRKKYKIAFMTRVNPEEIRCPEENQDIWIINGYENDIRPYRILIKEL